MKVRYCRTCRFVRGQYIEFHSWWEMVKHAWTFHRAGARWPK